MGSSSEALSLLLAPLLVSPLPLLSHRAGAPKIDPHQRWNEPRGSLRHGQDDPRRVPLRPEAEPLWV